MTEAQQQRYRVIERLASGGMAEVFLAENAGIEGFKKRVAIKRVLPHLSEKKKFIKMFLDEARLSAHLSHSNVAQVFDIGVGENVYFIVMEYVDGADLKAVIEFMKNARRPFPVESACFIVEKLCEGLTYAHELQGPDGLPLKIVHRDMSPPNVLITKYGEVKIVDFGLAKATSQLEKSEPGIIKGKFSYLSPEAATGSEVDQRTDVFAVGIILWELLAGRRLFVADNDFATVKMVQMAAVPPIRQCNPAVPPELEPIIARALARDPMARYPSARELGRDLTNFLFKFGRPVGAYDVAELVRGAMALRKRSQPDKASILDKLIEEALLEFTSLNSDKGRPSLVRADEPHKIDSFEDIAKWAEEISSPASMPPSANDMKALRSRPPSALATHGLASAAPAETHRSPSVGVVEAEAEAKAEAAPPEPDLARTRALAPASPVTPRAARSPEISKARGGGALKAALLLAALCLLFAGAWFGGLIPH
jgi:eukaryotic-like serine/threonine-protein kinase